MEFANIPGKSILEVLSFGKFPGLGVAVRHCYSMEQCFNFPQMSVFRGYINAEAVPCIGVTVIRPTASG